MTRRFRLTASAAAADPWRQAVILPPVSPAPAQAAPAEAPAPVECDCADAVLRFLVVDDGSWVPSTSAFIGFGSDPREALLVLQQAFCADERIEGGIPSGYLDADIDIEADGFEISADQITDRVWLVSIGSNEDFEATLTCRVRCAGVEFVTNSVTLTVALGGA